MWRGGEQGEETGFWVSPMLKGAREGKVDVTGLEQVKRGVNPACFYPTYLGRYANYDNFPRALA